MELCMIHQISAKLSGPFDSLFLGSDRYSHAGKIVAFIARINVQMIMPDVLPAIRLVVLPQGDPITLISSLHGQCNSSGAFMNFGCHRRRQVINVFVMHVGYNQYMSDIIERIMQAHESGHCVIASNDFIVFAFVHNAAKWTDVIFGRMVVQEDL